MNKIKSLLKSEFINGTKPFDWLFLGFGLLLQVVTIVLCAAVPAMHDDYLVVTAISGITGCISVVLCSRGKLSQYFFGYIQLFTYVFAVVIPFGLGGELVENIIYATTMLAGIIIWIKRYKKDENGELAVKTKNMSVKSWIISILVTAALIVGVAMIFIHIPSVNIFLTGSENPVPWLDSVTTIVPLVGQMLMVLGYSDQWIFWFIEDVMSLVMFIVLGNWVMVAQYIFWTANTIYGWLKWRKLAKEVEEE